MSISERIKRQDASLAKMSSDLDGIGSSIDAKNAEIARLRNENERLECGAGKLIDACREALIHLGNPEPEYDPDADLRRKLVSALAHFC